MKIFGKLALLGSLLLTFGLAKSNTNEVKSVDTTIEEMKKFDENIELGTPYFNNGDFNNPFNAHLMLRSGSNSEGLYRGYTSVSENESDNFALYDKREENTFVRFANFNGPGAKRTRMSSYYYDAKTGTPSNLRKTDYFNVSFDYRLYASDVDRMQLKPTDNIFRWQSRGSANNKSCDVLLGDLIINEEGDMTWHTYSYRVTCTYSMTTDYGWFFFYYHNIKPSMTPTFYADIDNFHVSLDDGINTVKQNGDFEFLSNGPYLQDANAFGDTLYPNFYSKSEYGKAVYQDNVDGKSFLRMDAKANRSTFTYKMNRELKNKTTIYLNFDYKDFSYYRTPDLDLYVNGKNSEINYQDIIGKEVLSENYISYVKEKENGWKNQSLYITFDPMKIDTLDFILDVECDMGIDNLIMADFISINYTSGNYTEFKNTYDNFLSTIGDYANKYTKSSIPLIFNAIEAAKKITENSSQAKMDNAISLINNALANIEEKGDLDKVHNYIDQIFDEMAGTNKNDYELRSYILFKYALEEAVRLNEDSTKEEVDNVYNKLVEAYENLIRKESE